MTTMQEYYILSYEAHAIFWKEMKINMTEV